jgi:hypothetical protein
LDRSGEHVRSITLVDTIIEGMESMGDRLHKEHELEFYFALACAYFGAGEMNKALFLVEQGVERQ